MREPTSELLRQLIEIIRQSQTRRLPAGRRRVAGPKVLGAVASKAARAPLGFAKP